MPTFYITSNHEYTDEAVALRSRLVAAGLKLTYDWTTHDAPHGSCHRLAAVAEDMAHGASDADLFVMIRPADRDASVELGVALSRHMLYKSNRIVLWEPDEDNATEVFGFGKNTCPFYHYPGVEMFVGNLDAVIAYLVAP